MGGTEKMGGNKRKLHDFAEKQGCLPAPARLVNRWGTRCCWGISEDNGLCCFEKGIVKL